MDRTFGGTAVKPVLPLSPILVVGRRTGRSHLRDSAAGRTPSRRRICRIARPQWRTTPLTVAVTAAVCPVVYGYCSYRTVAVYVIKNGTARRAIAAHLAGNVRGHRAIEVSHSIRGLHLRRGRLQVRTGNAPTMACLRKPHHRASCAATAHHRHASIHAAAGQAPADARGPRRKQHETAFHNLAGSRAGRPAHQRATRGNNPDHNMDKMVTDKLAGRNRNPAVDRRRPPNDVRPGGLDIVSVNIPGDSQSLNYPLVGTRTPGTESAL